MTRQSAVVSLNCGSSTVKFAVFVATGETRILSGLAEELGTDQARLTWSAPGKNGDKAISGADHRTGIEAMVQLIAGQSIHVCGIGHRVVHGGEQFTGPALVDDAVAKKIESLASLAPLHNPANLLGIRLMREHFPDVLQVAVFDTAFHQTLPARAFHYGLPPEYHQRYGVRKYGFHGTSHQYVASEAAHRLGRELTGLQLITAHLGNGCSACAIKDGRSVDTTMGLTPSEGMMMGTRSGDVDPLLHQFLAVNAKMTLDEITNLSIRRGGLLGVSGATNDVRHLETSMKNGDPRATLALEMFCFRAAKAILAMTASLDRLDALVFTGGIGEHSAWMRRRIVDHLSLLAIALDDDANNANGANSRGYISRPDTRACLVVPTNEELAIARDVWRLL